MFPQVKGALPTSPNGSHQAGAVPGLQTSPSALSP
jgi:hypothetical protein